MQAAKWLTAHSVMGNDAQGWIVASYLLQQARAACFRELVHGIPHVAVVGVAGAVHPEYSCDVAFALHIIHFGLYHNLLL
jgi:hypothetical protein